MMFRILVLAGSLLASPAAGAEFGGAAAVSRLEGACEAAIDRAERRHALPPGLLHAMGLVEAGVDGTVWPWAIRRGGRGRYLPDRAALREAVLDALSDGQRNVDVGCLQINLRWHPGAGPLTILSPAANAEYAAALLARLRRRHGSWTEAVKRYHSQDPDRQRRYACRVTAALLRLQSRAPSAATAAYCAASPR